MATTLTLDPSERGFITGATGYGKTAWAKHMLRQWARAKWRIVIIDGKHFWMGRKPEWETRGPGTIDKPRLVTSFNPKLAVQLFQPEIPAWHDESFNRFCDDVLETGDTVFYCDELDGIASHNQTVPGFSRIWTQGRAKDVAAWSGSQRPFHIPDPMKSQAEWWVVFGMRGPRNLQAAAEYTDTPQIATTRLPKFSYWLWHAGDTERARLMRPLALNKAGRVAA